MIVYLKDKYKERENLADLTEYAKNLPKFTEESLGIKISWYHKRFFDIVAQAYLTKVERNERKIKEFLCCPECWYTNKPEDVKITTSQDWHLLCEYGETLTFNGNKIAELRCYYCGYHRKMMLEP